MLQYRCDWCGREKRPDQRWIIGLAVQRSGVTGNRRQFETLKKWSAKWAAHPLAVHFCCDKHKDKYIEALFTSPWHSPGRNAIAKAAFLRRTEGAARKQDPDPVAEWYIENEDSASSQEEVKIKKAKRTGTRKVERESKHFFDDNDGIHARAFGIVLDPEEKPKSKTESRNG